MVAGGVVQVYPGVDGTVAEVLQPGPPGPPVGPRGVAAAVAVHDAECHRGRQRDHEGHREIVYYYGHLFVPDVVRQHDRSVLARVVAWELHPLGPVLLGEVSTQHRRRVPASLYVHQQHRVVCPIRGLPGVVVADVDVGAVVEVAGAALPAGAPAAVREPDQLLPARGHAGDRLRDEVRRQRRDRGVHVEGHEEQERRARRHRDHGQQARRVEQGVLPARPAGIDPLLLREGPLLQLPLPQFLLLVQEQFRAAAPHRRTH